MVAKGNEATTPETLSLPSDKMGGTILSTNRFDKELSCSDSQEAFVGTRTEQNKTKSTM